MTINSPWTDKDEKFSGMLGFIQQGIKQLEYFQKPKFNTLAIKFTPKGDVFSYFLMN